MNESLSTISPERPGATHDEISARAQQLWESLGRPVGRDEEIWLQAERELRATPAPVSDAPVPPASSPAAAEPSSPPRVKSSAVPRKASARGSKAATR